MVLRDKNMKRMQDLEKFRVFRVRWENALRYLRAKEILNPIHQYIQMGRRYRLTSKVGHNVT